MDERRHSTSVETRRDASSALPFAEQREQIRRFLGELSESTSSAEAEIAVIVKRLIDDVSTRGNAAGAKELAAREAVLAEERRQLDARRAEIEKMLEDATSRSGTSEEAERRLEAASKDLAEREQRLAGEVEETARLRTRLEEKLRRQETLEEELEAERNRTKVQRRRIAGEFREQQEAARREHQRHVDELEARREELGRRERELERRSGELEHQAGELAAALAAGSDDRQVREELTRLQQTLTERSTALVQAESLVGNLRSELEHARGTLGAAEQRLAEQAALERRYSGAQAEVAELREQLEELQAKLAGTSELRGAADEADDLRAALAAAEEDLRDLRNRNAVLEKSQAAGNRPSESALPMDWESQKRRLLASLESDSDSESPTDKADRLTIEGTIQITDNIVADKEREIAELRRTLEEQSGNVGDVAVGAAGFAAALDQDELIREHREQLEDLKRQWEEKLRSAEIEISIERAKVARERTLLEEKRADFEAQAAQLAREAAEPAAEGASEPKKKGAGGGRWLARLGLRDNEAG